MKMKFFSRLTCAVLTLAMLIPCMMITPASAATEDPAKINLYHYEAKNNGNSSRDKFRFDQFPSNIVDAFNKSAEMWRIFQQYSYTWYRPNQDPVKIGLQGMQLGNSPSWQYAPDTRYSGRPVEVLNDNPKAARILDNVWFDLGEVEYPIVTRGMGALNISLVYAGGVMSNQMLKQTLTDRFGGYFAPPVYSADNAAGIACLCKMREEEMG